jgi:hypothetical protein
MDSPGLPHLIQDEESLNHRTRDKLEALQLLMELIRQDSWHPNRTMQIDLWQSGP